jgi:hypothetical protein
MFGRPDQHDSTPRANSGDRALDDDAGGVIATERVYRDNPPCNRRDRCHAITPDYSSETARTCRVA